MANEADNILQVLIKIGLVTPENADKARTMLADINAEQARGVGVATDAAGAAGQLESKLSDQGETTFKLTNLHRELRSALFAVASQSPATGAALGTAFLGPIGAIIGAIALFREAKKALDDYNKSLDEEGAAAAQSFDDSYQHMEQAVDSLAESHAKFLAELSHAGKDDDPIATRVKNENALYDAQLAAIKKIIEAHDKLLGMSPEQIQADLASLEEKKKAHDRDSVVNEYLQRDAQQKDLEKNAEAADKRKAEADQKANNQATERANLEKQINGEKGQPGALQKAAEDAAKKVQGTPQTIGIPTSPDAAPVFVPNPAYAEAQKELNIAQGNLAREKARLAQLDKEAQAAKDAAAQADADATATKNAAVLNKKRTGELGGQIAQAQAQETGQAATGAEGTAISITDILAKGGKVTPEQAHFLTETASAIAGHSVDLTEAFKMFQYAAQHQVALVQQVARLVPVLSKLDPAATGRLEAEINRLDSEIATMKTQLGNHGP